MRILTKQNGIIEYDHLAFKYLKQSDQNQ